VERIAVSSFNRPRDPIPEPIIIPTRQHKTLVDAVRHSIMLAGHGTPQRAAMAVAAPVIGDMVEFPNVAGWNSQLKLYGASCALISSLLLMISWRWRKYQ
jgi:glucokinase